MTGFFAIFLILSFSVTAQVMRWPLTIDSGSDKDANFAGGSTTVISDPSVVDRTVRFGNFTYRVPVDNVPFIVTFNWIEQTVGNPGERLFQVKINDQILFDRMDLFVACGFMVPCSRSVIVIPAAGMLNIVFTTQARNAIVSSLSFTPLFAILGGANIDADPAILASVRTCDPAKTTPTTDCTGMYLLSLKQADGTGRNFVALGATPAISSSATWK